MRFQPRLRIADVGYWADRYQYADDAEVERIGRSACRIGYYTLADLLAISQWKTRGRSVHLCKQNTDAEIRQATTVALSTANERERLTALLSLHGVGVPTASVLLHLALGDAFPILDFRALWSLGVNEPPATYSFDYWRDYVQACRSLRAQANVTMRRLDRGLWQYSKEHQPAPSAQAQADGETKSGVTPVVSLTEAEGVMDRGFSVEAYSRLVAAAIEGRLIYYSDVASRGRVRVYLHRIAHYEKEHARPPLTAIVVHKQDGRPGKGFRIAMEQIGYAKKGESDDALWKRAVADVFAYWRA